MPYRLKTFIVLLIISAVLVPSFLEPLTARAQNVQPAGVTDILIGGGTCVASGLLANFVVDQIKAGLRWLIKDKTKQLTNTILGLNTFIANVPIYDDVAFNKEMIMDLSARCFARELIEDITARMVGAVRTGGRYSRGFNGINFEPSFVRDWRRFLANAQYRGEFIFRSVLNSTSLCNNVLNLKNIFQANNEPQNINTNTRINNLDPFTLRARCTMPQGWTLQKYSNDFAGQGGWEALTRLSQPQNNYYGALMLSLGELGAQRALEEKSDVQEAGPDSFFGRRGKPGNTCLVTSNTGACIVYKDILTPGSVLYNAANETIREGLTWLTSVDEWQEVIAAIMQTLMSRVLNLAQPSAYDQEDFPRETPPGRYIGEDFDFDVGTGIAPPTTECNDDDDNNGNGAIDYDGGPNGEPADSGCSSRDDDDENPNLLPEPPGSIAYGVTLQADNGQYVSAYSNGGDVILANKATPGQSETFRLLDLNGGTFEVGDNVAIRTSYGFYFELGPPLNTLFGWSNLYATGQNVFSDETFMIWEKDLIAGPKQIQNGMLVTFSNQTNLRYMSAVNGGGEIVHVNGLGAGQFETFKLNVLGAPPPANPKPPTIGETACSDGGDNDGDQLTDLDDPECNNDPLRDSEGAPFVCSNGLDDDGDGETDWLSDFDCAGDPRGESEGFILAP